MRILGIDPALSVTGYGVIDTFAPPMAELSINPEQPEGVSLSRRRIDTHRGSLSLIKAGVIITSSRDNLPERLNKIYEAVIALMAEVKPEVLVLEKLYVHYRHPTTAYILGQARGIICLACAKCDVPLIECAATQVKKAVVGRGLASKYQIQKMVASMLNLKELPRYSDVTDALALAITYSHTVKSGIANARRPGLEAISRAGKLYRRSSAARKFI